MSEMPTILFTLERYDKSGGGVYEVIHQIAKRFHANGYNVKIAATNSGGRLPIGQTIEEGIEVNRFELSGSLVNGIQGNVEAYKDFLLAQEYDVFINYAAQQAMTDICFLYSKDIDKKKIIIPCGYSGLYWPHFEQYFKHLPVYLQRYDAQIFHTVNYRDYEYAEKNNLKNLFFAPNGFDQAELDKPQPSFRERHGISKNKKLLLHVGNITGTKGHVEALLVYMLSMVHNSVLVFIGMPLHPKSKYLMALAKMCSWFTLGWRKIYFLEYHHPETIQILRESDAFLFFSNIEYSPLVLFEAAAVGLPFLASDCGNSAEIAEWSGMGQIVETHKTPKGMSKINVMDAVKRLRKLLSSPKPQPKPEFLAQYSWDEIYKKYEEAVRQVIK